MAEDCFSPSLDSQRLRLARRQAGSSVVAPFERAKSAQSLTGSPAVVIPDSCSADTRLRSAAEVRPQPIPIAERTRRSRTASFRTRLLPRGVSRHFHAFHFV